MKSKFPESAIKKTYEKRVPLNKCEKITLNKTINKHSKKLNMVKLKQTGMFERPSLKNGIGRGIKFSITPINALNPAK